MGSHNLKAVAVSPENFEKIKDLGRAGVPKFRHEQRLEVQAVVADLTIKGISDNLIIQHIGNTTGQTISDRSLRKIREGY